MTVREFCLRAMAYERTSVQPWQIARWSTFQLLTPHGLNKNVTVFDLLPLPGDPTKEERKEQGGKQRKSQIAIYELKKERYKQLGLISDLPINQST